MKKLLSSGQIEEAKQLKNAGWSKNKLALRYGVSPTTIWDHVYATQKRIKQYVITRTCCYFCDLPLKYHMRCSDCHKLLHDNILKDEYTERYICGCGINHTAYVHNLCVSCYASKNNIEFPMTTYKHTQEELSRVFGKSKEQIASIEKRISIKIVKDTRLVGALQETGKHEHFVRRKIKHIEDILSEIPEPLKYKFEELSSHLEAWKGNLE